MDVSHHPSHTWHDEIFGVLPWGQHKTSNWRSNTDTIRHVSGVFREHVVPHLTIHSNRFLNYTQLISLPSPPVTSASLHSEPSAHRTYCAISIVAPAILTQGVATEVTVRRNDDLAIDSVGSSLVPLVRIGGLHKSQSQSQSEHDNNGDHH